MSNPIPASVLSAIAMARRLSAIALWFATVFGRILPGAARRAEQAEAWRFIEATMTQFADLLERLAAGEVEPPPPTRTPSRHPSRPDSVRPRVSRPAPRTPRAPTPPPEAAQPRPALPPLHDPSNALHPTLNRPAKPKFSKMNHSSPHHSRALFVTLS